MRSIWKIIRIALVAVGVIVLAAVVKLGLSGYELQVSGIKNQVIEIRFDRTNKVRYDEMVKLLREAGRYKADTADVEINYVPDIQRSEEIMDYFALGQCTPGIIAVNHLNQHIAGEDLAVIGLGNSGLGDLGDSLHGNGDGQDLILKGAAFDRLFDGGLYSVFITGIGMHYIPFCIFSHCLSP